MTRPHSTPTNRPRPGRPRLGIAVRTGCGTLLPGELCGLNRDCARIRFPKAPTLDLDEPITLVFEAARHHDLTIPARPRAVEEGSGPNDVIEFGFEFGRPGPNPLAPSQGPDPRGNHRQALRIGVESRRIKALVRHACPNLGATVQELKRLLTDPRKNVQGKLIDISADGVGVAVKGRDGDGLAIGDHLDLTFVLPGASEPVLIGARAVWVASGSTGTRCGLSFEPRITASLRASLDHVTEFVMSEQRRFLQGKSG